jgi:glycosyltransferase involved in cell wall biosynthesis
VARAVAAAALATPPVALGALSDADLRLAYAGAAAVAVPSRHEGFGLPALEAMAVGAPVVASDAGGLPEVVGDAGVVVPTGSVAALTGALYRLAFEFHRTEREGLIQRGLIRARQFPWDRSARATCAAYEQALRGAA